MPSFDDEDDVPRPAPRPDRTRAPGRAAGAAPAGRPLVPRVSLLGWRPDPDQVDRSLGLTPPDAPKKKTQGG